jgi:hypothetical protein
MAFDTVPAVFRDASADRYGIDLGGGDMDANLADG